MTQTQGETTPATCPVSTETAPTTGTTEAAEIPAARCPMAHYPATRTVPLQPPPEYAELLAEAPVSHTTLPNGTTAWTLANHADVRAMLVDPRFSSDRLREGFPFTSVEPPAELGFRRSLISMDAPDHGVARRAVVGEFTVKRMAALRPRIQQIVDERIDALLAGPRPADLVAELSLPVPSLVICELLGVPYADHDFFQRRSSLLLARTIEASRRRGASDELRAYLDRLVTAKEADLTDDLLGRQAAAGADHDELVSLAFLLLVAGHETTANMISLGTVALLDAPETLATVRAEPERYPDVVEELLRHFTVAEFATARVATEDVDFRGHHIRAGEGVIGLSNSANHDPAAFADPDRIDIDRGARHHVAFGFGPHQCLGQNLARMELQIVFETLFRRIPELRVAVAPAELPFKHDSNIYGLYELPVQW